MAGSPPPYRRTRPDVPERVSRLLLAGTKAYFGAVAGMVLLVELAALVGYDVRTAPLLTPVLLVFWVYALHAGIGGFAGTTGPLTVVFGFVLAVTLVAFGYATAREQDPRTAVTAFAHGSSLVVGYLPLLVLTHAVTAITVPSVAPFDADALRLFLDIGLLYPIAFGGVGGFLYGWWSVPAGVDDV